MRRVATQHASRSSRSMRSSIAARNRPGSLPPTAERSARTKRWGCYRAIFDEDILGELSGHIAVGHTRYSTSGSSIVVNAQPLLERTELGDFAFAHNGNLTNTDELRETLSPTTVLHGQLRFGSHGEADRRGEGFDARSHSSACSSVATRRVLDRALHARRTLRVSRSVGRAAAVPGHTSRRRLRRRVGIVRARHRSARSTCAKSIAARSCASTVEGLESHPDAESKMRTPALCMFEYIYFARPDSQAQRALDLHGALRDGASSSAQRTSRRRRRRYGRARLGRSRRHRLRCRERAAVRRRADQEPLHRPHVHQPRSNDAHRAAST